MAGCSLCGSSIEQESGAILFTDKWGIPFEVCGTCEEQVDILQNSKDEAETRRALEYVSVHAKEIKDKNNYKSFMGFVRENATLTEVETEINEHDKGGEASPEAAAAEKKSRRRDFVLLIILGILLVLACTISGFKF